MTAMVAPNPAQSMYGLGASTASGQVPFGSMIQPQIGQIQPQAAPVVPPAAILHASQLAAAAVLDLVPYVIQARLVQMLPQFQFGAQWFQPWSGQQALWGQQVPWTQQAQWTQQIPWSQQAPWGQQASWAPWSQQTSWTPWTQQVQPQFGGAVGSFL
ncbi:hypothetical protein MOQ72_24330 [Saccharopolyspora sp. K220]|uniref:hypothetical protein n=1 Tax=Saccharopolyspora soli TaxID=2926618 RepID=UPI001F57423E|nr:hypothetical protein [Saccharopolyspora soli]MCI2420583.1 hypothetical protein [Saccharopolyspora soli]